MFEKYAVVIVPSSFNDDDDDVVRPPSIVSIHSLIQEAFETSRSENMGRDYSSTAVMGVNSDGSIDSEYCNRWDGAIAPAKTCSQCSHFVSFATTSVEQCDGACFLFMDSAGSSDPIATICKGYSA